MIYAVTYCDSQTTDIIMPYLCTLIFQVHSKKNTVTTTVRTHCVRSVYYDNANLSHVQGEDNVDTGEVHYSHISRMYSHLTIVAQYYSILVM